MKNQYYKDLKIIFETHKVIRDEFPELYETITLINKAIELQEESNEVNKKLNELNKEVQNEK